MFGATYFTYDGVFSGVYGLTLADFNDSSVVETTAFSPVLLATKPTAANRFFHNGVVYDSAPQFSFSVISETEINDICRREILSWLVGRNEYKRLELHHDGIENYYYNCVFTDTQIIFVHGRCHGFRLTANFDSPYAYGRPTQVIVPSGSHTVIIENKSDIKDDYVYPVVKFTGGGVDIVNETDDPDRHFKFADLNPLDVVTVDNEVKHISATLGGEKLSNFTSKKWLRLLGGRNTLRIESMGEVTITCPNYMMIGF